jgi:hypothetical protein
MFIEWFPTKLVLLIKGTQELQKFQIDITEILLKVALNTTIPPHLFFFKTNEKSTIKTYI